MQLLSQVFSIKMLYTKRYMQKIPDMIAAHKEPGMQQCIPGSLCFILLSNRKGLAYQ